MKPQTLIDVFDAAHLTRYVESEEFPKRGGIMVVGPPGALKTSLMLLGIQVYPDALILSDLNVTSLMGLRDELIGGRFSTIVFPEFEKLYQRKAESSSNVEGTLKQLVEDGFTRASFEPQGMISMNARAMVIGAQTYSFYTKHYQNWKNDGFLRRFLWCSIKLKNPDRILQSIHKWEKIQLDGIPRKHPTGIIKMNVEENESKFLLECLQTQQEATPFVLLKKIMAVLKWKYKNDPKRPMQIMKEFSQCLKGTATIEL